jgi:phosphoserine phosphatase RsbU/P
MSDSIRILLIEDSETDADLVVRFLKREGLVFEHQRVSNRQAFISAMDAYVPDIVISDYSIPQFNGMEAFRLLKSLNRNCPFILITGTLSEEILVEFAKEGIDDYILKDNLLRLPISIENVMNRKTIEKLHRRLEIVHREVQDSINYAKMIQSAMLPDTAQLKESFPNSFIFFRPKDVLSGDFYWFKKINNHFVITVADCTGHGVPGSLLSMIGFNMLYEAVTGRKLRQPSDILDNLRRQFQRIRQQSTVAINDGMDVACCAIDLEHGRMTYSGANRPLYLIREGELFEYKPDKASISGADSSHGKFSLHNIPIQSGDRLFLFSDGYADQFHYATKKKLLIKRFRELLINSSRAVFHVQEKALAHYFEEWKGGMEQVDDVLLVGIQIPGKSIHP